MLEYALFAIGFALLVKGADFLVDGAASIARKINVSDLVIGLTVVAFGTSTPELTVNVLSSFYGTSDIAVGNILGSNIANILLILGISAMIFPLKVTQGTIWKEIPLSLLAAVMVFVLASDALIDNAGLGVLTRIDGIVLLAFFAIFLVYVFEISKKNETANEQQAEVRQYSPKKSAVLIIVGLAGLVVGGNLVVNGAVTIASNFGVSQSLIGLTVVAVGTSLPELATSAVAAFKKNTDIAIGNVVGSNIFNVFFILGISAIINPLPFTAKTGIIDLSMTIFSSFLLFAALFVGKKHVLEKWQGAAFLVIYAAYIAFLVING